MSGGTWYALSHLEVITISYVETFVKSWLTVESGSLNLLDRVQAIAAGKELRHYIGLSLRVIDQMERRVFKEESVPSKEKVVSIFEEHTDIIVKDHRQTLYGHKICLTSGRSSLITDCTILEGNPASKTWPVSSRQQRERSGSFMQSVLSAAPSRS